MSLLSTGYLFGPPIAATRTSDGTSLGLNPSQANSGSPVRESDPTRGRFAFMYNHLFGLRKDPFRVIPDPSSLFLTDQHREALSGLTFAILQRSGVVVLTGEVGTGKTTLLARILRFLPASKLQYSQIVNPILTPSEFLELALLEFGLRDIPSNKGQRLWMLRNLVLE